MKKIFFLILSFIFVIVFCCVVYANKNIENRAGCCSSHSGVCGCNKVTGHQLCCDGTDSPSCLCGH